MAMATLPNPTDAVPETLLWCGVLNQAISDIKGGANSCRKPRDVRAARAWRDRPMRDERLGEREAGGGPANSATWHPERRREVLP